MEELDRLQKGIETSQTMLLKYEDNGLACSFLKGGLVQDDFIVQDEDLAQVLKQTGIKGVVEGNTLERFRHNYGWFSLRVKSRKLLKELK